MIQIVSISSKNQVAIPIKISRLLNINRGDKLLIRVDSDKIIMEKAKKILDQVAGSIKIPKNYKNKSISFIIKDSKKKYFSSK